MVLTARQGYEIWSSHYDTDPNPLIALESRLLAPRLGNLESGTVLDVATGTGRWMTFATNSGARAFGIDLSPQMLNIAARKPILSGRLVCGDARSLPFGTQSVDLAICSFALSYLPFATGAFGELTRVARRVILSDLHPTAMLRGWTRSFRDSGQDWKIEHFYHSLADLTPIAEGSGMRLRWTAEATFDLPEKAVFEAAGKGKLFEEVRHTPAVLAACWSRP